MDVTFNIKKTKKKNYRKYNVEQTSIRRQGYQIGSN